MPKKQYHVQLDAEQRATLEQLISTGQAKARTLTRARILLKVDAGWSDRAISKALAFGVSVPRRLSGYASALSPTDCRRRSRENRPHVSIGGNSMGMLKPI